MSHSDSSPGTTAPQTMSEQRIAGIEARLASAREMLADSMTLGFCESEDLTRDVSWLLAELRDVRAALREARKDSERLDWFTEHRCYVSHLMGARGFAFNVTREHHSHELNEGPTLREAIDEAKARAGSLDRGKAE